MRTSRINVAAVLLANFFRQCLATLDDELLGFLLISTPQSGKVQWVKVPQNGDIAHATKHTLLDEGLQHPQGLAIDHKRKRLFVADPDVQKIYAYTIKVSGDSLSTDGRQTIVADGVESRWVAVDGLGNVFFTDEPKSEILKISMQKMVRGSTVPEVMYAGSNLTQVNHPGGVAVDNFHVFWSNKRYGTQAGTIVKGSEVKNPTKPAEFNVDVLAKNSPKSYGVCLALNNVFFTDSEKSIYGVKKSGGEVVEVNNKLKKPRGCVWDGDGTIFVADREQNAIYSFPGNMGIITQADVKKVMDIEDAFGLAFMSDASRLYSFLAVLVPVFTAARF
jgi:hypothetical protein